MIKKVTVTVGIPAFNEESNIVNLLSSIVRQKGNSYKLKQIIVVCDKSTDNTVQKALDFAKDHTNITVYSGEERRGKVVRLNQLYALNTSEIFIQFDADICLATPYTIEEMVKVFLTQKKAVMVAAHQIPIPSNTFTGKIIYAGYQFWDITRLSVKNYDHIQNHYGAATALKKEFLKYVQYPADITDDRGYLYILAKKYGNFVYTKNAHIFYRPVSTLKDFLTLSDRAFEKNQDALTKYFSKNVYDMYHIPLSYKIRAISIMFLKSPLYTSLAVFLNMYIRIFPKHDMLYTKGMWEICVSTKEAITIESLLTNLPSYRNI